VQRPRGVELGEPGVVGQRAHVAARVEQREHAALVVAQRLALGVVGAGRRDRGEHALRARHLGGDEGALVGAARGLEEERARVETRRRGRLRRRARRARRRGRRPRS
jgi:hypothetical protein